jgi:cell division septal protein FtsQ
MAAPKSSRRPPAVRASTPAALRPGARPGGGIRRTRSVKRRSAGVTPVRAGALLALLVAAGGLYGAISSDVFTARRTTVSGNTWTSEASVLAAIALPQGQNVFTVRPAELEARLAAIPALRGAAVSVALPDEVRVQVAEREPLLAWAVLGRRFLVDADGFLFGELAGGAEAGDLPVIDDRRSVSGALEVGSVLDPVSLDAALRLASLTPEDVGSGGTSLGIRVDDRNGFVVRGAPAGWDAIFGFYTPTLRTTDTIPGQVRLLRSLLLAHGEDRVLRAVLADEGSGTYVPRATPKPSATPRP